MPSVNLIRRPSLLAAIALAAAPIAPVASPELDLARQLNRAFVEVAESVSPAVVVLQVRPKEGADLEEKHGGFLDLLPEETRKELQEWMERERNRPRRPPPPDYFPEQGSGVVFREDGYIITNGHVVEDAEKIEVHLRDGRRLPAEVRGVDAESDIAVLKVDARDLPVARLGDSAKVRVGEFAIAIGAPFRFEYSVTFGHVSAKGRSVMMDTVMMDQDFLQTDASINPGNSGGPLVNIEGEVIGINTLIRGVNTGIGFAVPVNLAREVADQLIEKGRFTRAWLGVNIEPVNARPRTDASESPVHDGVLVTRVLRDGPSWNSELEAEDIIVGVQGEPVRTVGDLKRLISRKKVGSPVQLDVYRDGKKLELTVTPGELPENRIALMRPPRIEPAEAQTEAGVGLKVRELDSENAERVGLERGGGVLVVEVEEDSPAAAGGIRAGEVITKINRRPVRNPKEFGASVREADLAKGVTVTVVSEDGRRFKVLRKTGEPGE